MRKFIVSGSRRFDDQEFMEFAFALTLPTTSGTCC